MFWNKRYNGNPTENNYVRITKYQYATEENMKILKGMPGLFLRQRNTVIDREELMIYYLISLTRRATTISLRKKHRNVPFPPGDTCNTLRIFGPLIVNVVNNTNISAYFLHDRFMNRTWKRCKDEHLHRWGEGLGLEFQLSWIGLTWSSGQEGARHQWLLPSWAVTICRRQYRKDCHLTPHPGLCS